MTISQKLLLYAGILIFLSSSCSKGNLSRNNGADHLLNIIPQPQEATLLKGTFVLNRDTRICFLGQRAKLVAEFYADKLRRSTGYPFKIEQQESKGTISLQIDPSINAHPEGYSLVITSKGVTVKAATPQGLFYGMASFLQMLPPQIESDQPINSIEWVAPCIRIADYPRFNYRGLMIDVARHFVSVEGLKKHIDMLATFKINRLHLHLSDYQGWRVEIKKYPKLTSVGSKRIDEYGQPYSGYYTQDEIRELVRYASERFITIIPEIDVPGHSLAAIAAYPELSCTGATYPVMNRWGGFPVVFCPGKEVMFDMLDDIFSELSRLFPSEYFHIGGDECPKEVWKQCANCQKRIEQEGLKADKKHSAEDRLQSYAISRCEKILRKYGKKMIGWDEILEGGLAPDATVMSWRGESGGITSALMGHDVIMTPTSGGMYLDHYQGDYLADEFAWGGYAPIRTTYSYDPVPDTLVTMGKDKYVIGVQANAWTECMYTEDLVEYSVYPRILAVAEIGWSNPKLKNFDVFSRRLDEAAVRMDYHHINYHIPLPEQVGGAFNHMAFVDSIDLDFTSTRPIKMIYTLDGSDPLPTSTVYRSPIRFTQSGTLKIRSILPSGKMSRIRTIQVEKQKPLEAVQVKPQHRGLQLKISDTRHLHASELKNITQWKDSTLLAIEPISRLRPHPLKDVVFYAAIATGFVNIESEGVYTFSSNNTRVWIDGRLAVDNDGRPQVNSKWGYSLALKKGWHAIKIEQISNSIGGWNSQHRNSGEVLLRKYDEKKYRKITPDQLGYSL